MVNGSRTFSRSAKARSSSIGPRMFVRGVLGSIAPGSICHAEVELLVAMRRIQSRSLGKPPSISSV